LTKVAEILSGKEIIYFCPHFLHLTHDFRRKIQIPHRLLSKKQSQCSIGIAFFKRVRVSIGSSIIRAMHRQARKYDYARII
jgi:hypothetical protein